MQRTCTLLAAAAATLFAVQAVAATGATSPIKSGRTVTIQDRELKFKEPVNACLKLCTNVILERQTFECRGYFEIPYDGCPLPWIDSQNPNPDLGGWCVPPENQFGGYLLSERVERIEQQVRQGPDCRSVVTETVLQVLPNLGNPPRPCPDPGPWDSTSDTVLSIQFVACR
jgi:hypothetical protein